MAEKKRPFVSLESLMLEVNSPERSKHELGKAVGDMPVGVCWGSKVRSAGGRELMLSVSLCGARRLRAVLFFVCLTWGAVLIGALPTTVGRQKMMGPVLPAAVAPAYKLEEVVGSKV